MKLLLFLFLFSIIFSICGCGYLELYEKSNYVSAITGVIKKNEQNIDNYIEITNDTESDSKDIKNKLEEIKTNFIKNKEEIEKITVPKQYNEEHKKFINGVQYCIEAVDISINILDIKNSNSTFEINDITIENLIDTVEPEKLNSLEPLKKKKFSEKEIKYELKKLNFKDKEIDLILTYSGEKVKRINEAKAKMDEGCKDIRTGINQISIDLR